MIELDYISEVDCNLNYNVATLIYRHGKAFIKTECVMCHKEPLMWEPFRIICLYCAETDFSLNRHIFIDYNDEGYVESSMDN
jgi:hypothetical protein